MKMPPIEKIAEAFSALADHRVELSRGRATVKSSDESKSYLVEWNGDEYSSNDPATFWQGYPGYPVIAVLMLQGRVPYNPEVSAWFAGLNWRQLNQAHKNNYPAALEEVMAGLVARGAEIKKLNQAIDEAYRALAALDLSLKRPKAKKALK